MQYNIIYYIVVYYIIISVFHTFNFMPGKISLMFEQLMFSILCHVWQNKPKNETFEVAMPENINR